MHSLLILLESDMQDKLISLAWLRNTPLFSKSYRNSEVIPILSTGSVLADWNLQKR